MGCGQYLKYLLPALLEHDDTLELSLIWDKPFGDKPKTLASYPESRLKFHVARTPFGNRVGNLAKVWFEQITFPRACRKLGVDVAHVPYFGSPLAPALPTVVTIHDLIPMILPAYRGRMLVRLYTSLAAAAASQAQLILADSEASKRDILAKLKVPAEGVRVVYLAPAPHFTPPNSWAEIEALKAKYKLPEAFVLYLGGYDIRKNISALLHAYTWVSHTLGDQFPLVLAGQLPVEDSDFKPDPLKIARKLKIEDYIVCPGWIEEEDRPLLYAAATVFVFPSRYEGFGLPVLEAMACGTPVVTSNAASIPELAGPAAFQVDPDDTKHLAAPIIRLCTEEESQEEMGERGLAQVEKFSWAKTARQTVRAYRDVLEK